MKPVLIIGLLLAAMGARAQSFTQKLSGGFDGVLGIPQGQFKQVNDNVALGLKGHIMYNFDRKVPLHIGLELGYGTMGTKTRYFYDSYFDQYEVTASSNIFTVLLKLRVQQPKNVSVRPFAEGLIGWNDFFSTVNVERITYFSTYYNNRYGESSEAQWALTYGGAAGLDIRLQKQGNLWLEIKTAYMIGRNTRYLTNPQITSTGQVYFTENESETNMLIPQVGIRLGL